MQIIGVGTPDNRVGGNGLYVTLYEDLIMQFVRFAALQDSTLPSNVTNLLTDTDTEFSGHEFIVSYLNGDRSGPTLRRYAKAAIVNAQEDACSPDIDRSE